MKNTKKKICWNAFYAIGGSIGVAIIITIGCAALITLPGIIAIALAWVMTGISVIGLFKNTRPQRDGVFSALLIMHVIIFVISLASGPIAPFFGIIAVIIAIVFDSLYEGLENSRQKNSVEEKESINITDQHTVPTAETETNSSVSKRLHKPIPPEERTGVIEIKDIKKEFNHKFVLKDVNVNLEPGKVYGFLGNNGAGKTTLMRIIFNMELPTSGHISYKGITQRDINYSEWFYFTETDSVPTNYTVWNYLKELSYLYDIPMDVFEKRVNEITGFLDFNFSLDSMIKSLSSGQQKIVNCMALLVIKPKIIFLDEPTANMDVWNQRIVMKIIDKMKSENRIIVITTHLLKEIGDTLTDVVILDGGEVRYQAPLKKGEVLEDVFKKYTTDTSATDFLDVDNPNVKPKKKTYDSNSFDKKKIGAYLNE